MATPQLPLAVTLPATATFDSFAPGSNGAAIAALRDPREPFVTLWGGSGCGRSHLLQAACREAAQARQRVHYLPLADHAALQPVLLEGVDGAALLCLDDIDRVAGDRRWETALFHAWNRVREGGGRLLSTLSAAPGQVAWVLPDLASRIAWGGVFHLQPVDDDGRLDLLERHCHARGLTLETGVARYLLQRCARDPASLVALVERLDHASLAAGRRLTIPFVRELIY